MNDHPRVTTFQGIVNAARIRRKMLGMPQLAVDDAGGLQTGYTGKLECGDKGLGAVSLPLLLGALGLELVVAPAVRPSRTHRDEISKSDDYFRSRTRKASQARWAKTTPKQRRKIMRQVAKARWAKARKGGDDA